MALGGGTFVTQNKVLPGSYINFVSTSSGVNVFGERGTGVLGLALDWGNSTPRSITKEDFQKNSLSIFGYEYTSEKLKAVRDFFKNGKTLIFANLAAGTQAGNVYAKAKYPGARGNDIKIVVQTNADDDTKKDVLTYIGATLADSQTVTGAGELIDNNFVSFIRSGVLADTAGTNLTGGTNGSVTGNSVQNFLAAAEAYTFNAIGIIVDDSVIEGLEIEWTKRMRNEAGKKFQCVTVSESGDFEGNIYVANELDDADNENIIAWVVGAAAGCEINKSLTNTEYNGEYTINGDYSQTELEDFINRGCFAFHKVNDEVRVLMDINSLTTFTEEKGSVFSDNQTVRVCDQIAMDVAAIFNNYYLGKVPNDDAGRTSFWSEIVKHHETLAGLRAIEDFNSEDITVEQGETKKSVVVTDCITVVNTMAQLYMTVVVE